MTETIHVLCVDDEINILNVIKRQLSDENLEIHCVTTGEEGLRLLRQMDRADVILTDYRMPGMNGIEFLKQAQMIRPESIGIILSGFADIPLVKKSLENNQLFRCLRKPWRAEELRAAIAEAVHTSREATDPSRGLTGI